MIDLISRTKIGLRMKIHRVTYVTIISFILVTCREVGDCEVTQRVDKPVRTIGNIADSRTYTSTVVYRERNRQSLLKSRLKQILERIDCDKKSRNHPTYLCGQYYQFKLKNDSEFRDPWNNIVKTKTFSKMLERYKRDVHEMTDSEPYVMTNTTNRCENVSADYKDDGIYCNMTWDMLSCWPVTPAGKYAIISCPENLEHLIDPTKNATKFCYLNGTWASRANYNNCFIQSQKTNDLASSDKFEEIDAICGVIYILGYSVSTVALLAALFIFMYFRSLRCIRNFIHSHLIVTFILRNVVYIVLNRSLKEIVDANQTWACQSLVSIFNYAQVTNFFWMLVEGLYLHIIIVWTYQADKIRKWYFIVIGWGMPFFIVGVWIGVRAHFQSQEVATGERNPVFECWIPTAKGSSHIDNLDYIYISPILLVLAINLAFLASIIWVLVTKLRASTSWETRQLRKAVKATLLLFPLLGLTYVIFLMPPSEEFHVIQVHLVTNAFLQSFQGFFVALFYCFLNGEVKTVLKKKFSLFQESRSLSTRYTRTSIGWTNDVSVVQKDQIDMKNGRPSIRFKQRESEGMTIHKEETENML